MNCESFGWERVLDLGCVQGVSWGLLATYLGGLCLGLVTFGGNLNFPPKGISPKVGMGLKVKIKCWVVITK